ncbi:hypothetical protein CHGG_02200 [Chaetomium globosum CBS 148.51]|uniref:Uncharacterized protein n=1 Tax=Chaetomium globosum (strain ATCC 6205 / CBS 148.51 / DSM 1962 / NBRC 6347 / NRRL 1970) TaxID=306901 RepID=Q2HC54_CHAGB|nr:uncharacterized protein CHGG_02200 [Chaetomium globosum CBS 148.51]EAQ90265.1 hypothetical protein CHGG_02200 [Chaetomium globosum CBS 148.51]
MGDFLARLPADMNAGGAPTNVPITDGPSRPCRPSDPSGGRFEWSSFRYRAGSGFPFKNFFLTIDVRESSAAVSPSPVVASSPEAPIIIAADRANTRFLSWTSTLEGGRAEVLGRNTPSTSPRRFQDGRPQSPPKFERENWGVSTPSNTNSNHQTSNGSNGSNGNNNHNRYSGNGNNNNTANNIGEATDEDEIEDETAPIPASILAAAVRYNARPPPPPAKPPHLGHRRHHARHIPPARRPPPLLRTRPAIYPPAPTRRRLRRQRPHTRRLVAPTNRRLLCRGPRVAHQGPFSARPRQVHIPSSSRAPPRPTTGRTGTGHQGTVVYYSCGPAAARNDRGGASRHETRALMRSERDASCRCGCCAATGRHGREWGPRRRHPLRRLVMWWMARSRVPNGLGRGIFWRFVLRRVAGADAHAGSSCVWPMPSEPAE